MKKFNLTSVVLGTVFTTGMCGWLYRINPGMAIGFGAAMICLEVYSTTHE